MSTTVLAPSATSEPTLRTLDPTEIDATSGGFIWIPVVVGSFLLGTGIRMGLDALVDKITAPRK